MTDIATTATAKDRLIAAATALPEDARGVLAWVGADGKPLAQTAGVTVPGALQLLGFLLIGATREIKPADVPTAYRGLPAWARIAVVIVAVSWLALVVAVVALALR